MGKMKLHPSRKKIKPFLYDNFTSEKTDVVNKTITTNRSTLTKNFSVDENYTVQEGIPGIPNEFATKLVLMLMGFMITLILLCLFLLITIYIYYKEKEEVFGNNKIGPTSVKIDKVHSPYIITPEQKITQQLLASQVVTPIECSVNDIAQLVQYLALHGHFSEDEIYRTPRTFIRLVPRRKTKFDEEDSRKEQKSALKSESKSKLSSGIRESSTIKKSKKTVQQQELPGKLDHNGGTERSQKKDNIAMKSGKKKRRKKRSSELKLSAHLIEASPNVQKRLAKKRSRRKHSKELGKRRDLEKRRDRVEMKRKKQKHLKKSKYLKKSGRH